MIIAAIFIFAALGIMVFPMLVPYLLLSYMVVSGIASRSFINELKFSVGGTNMFFPDLLYAASLFLAVYGVMRLILSGRLRSYAPLTRSIVYVTVIYFVFIALKIINGFFDGTPIDTLVRRFAADTQCVYLFVPLLYVKQEEMLKRLLYFVLAVSFLFPLMQPFLYGSADQVALQAGQGGTLRLGSGNANLFLMLGVLALFVWERKLWLSALPLAGIAMLAQRSAFVSLTLCIIMLAFQKKKSAKFIALMAGAGLLLLAALVVIQSTTSVPVVDKAMERFSQTFEKTGTTAARMLVIPMALSEIGNRPLVGYSYYDIYALTLIQNTDAAAFNMLHPHNFVLSSLLRTGLIGSLLLFGIIGLVMRAALQISKQKDTKEQGMYLFSTILFFVVFGVMNTSFFSAGYVFWMLAGITLWYLNEAYYLKQQPNKELQSKQIEVDKPKPSRLLRSKKSL